MSIKIKQSETKKMPSLHFPNFSDEWEEKKLGDVVAKFLKGKNLSKGDIVKDGKNKCIRYGELYTDYREIIKRIRSKTNILGKNLILSIKGDLLIPSSGETTLDIAIASCLKENNILIGGDINILRLKNNNDGSFFAYYLSNFKKKNFARLSQGYSVVHLYSHHFRKLDICVPSFIEQQKIAGFLGTTDEWIKNLHTQKENIESYKKGMMQKIFSREIRFRGDNEKDFPEWKEKRLKEFLKERKEYSTKGKEYTHISLTTKGIVPKSERYDRNFLVNNDETKKYKITKIDDLCYNPANLKFGVISINKLSAGIFSPIYVTFEILNQNVDFIGYYLVRDAFINKARRYEQGTVYERMAVHPSDFLSVKILLPSVSEQQKIADFLTSIDNLIESKQQQITQAEQWKKGLMQGLFV